MSLGDLGDEETFRAVLDFAVSEGEDFDVTITPRPGTRVVKLDSLSANKLRDLAGAVFDMKRVVALCKEYVLATENCSSQVVRDALWMTAIVLYARCFNGGVRRPLDTAVLDSIPGESRELHQHFLHLRDKFIAHSVNSYEQTLVYAVIDSATGEVTSTGTTHLWANPMNTDGAKSLERLAMAFYNAGMRQRQLLEIIIGSEIDGLDRAALDSLPDLAVDPPSARKSGARRKA